MAKMQKEKEKEKVPLIEGLFTWPSDSPKLIVSRCKKCGTVAFPAFPFCHNPKCEKVRENMEKVELSRRGVLYSYAYQHYQAPAPFRYEPFRPYAVGMVDFPEGIRIWGMVTRAEGLKIGMPVETTVGKLYEEEGKEYITWMWKPLD